MSGLLFPQSLLAAKFRASTLTISQWFNRHFATTRPVVHHVAPRVPNEVASFSHAHRAIHRRHSSVKLNLHWRNNSFVVLEPLLGEDRDRRIGQFFCGDNLACSQLTKAFLTESQAYLDGLVLQDRVLLYHLVGGKDARIH